MGLLVTLLSLPKSQLLGMFFCLAYLLAGGIAVWHYTNEHGVTLKGSQGVALGALSGAISAAVAAVLTGFLMALDVLPSLEEQMTEQIEGMEDAEATAAMGVMRLFVGPAGGC